MAGDLEHFHDLGQSAPFSSGRRFARPLPAAAIPRMAASVTTAKLRVTAPCPKASLAHQLTAELVKCDFAESLGDRDAISIFGEAVHPVNEVPASQSVVETRGYPLVHMAG